MFIRLVIYLALSLFILAGGTMISSRSARTAVSDKTLTAQTAQLDNALLRYYATHSELPSSLSKEFLEMMGLHDISPNNFIYSAKARSFILRTKYSNGEKSSAHSNLELPEISEESS